MGFVGTKAFSGWSVGDGVDEVLLVRLPSSKAVKTDFVMGEIDFSSDQAIRPKRIKEIGAALDLDLPTIVGAAQVDDRAFEWKLVIGMPILRERVSCRRSVHTWRRPLACCASKAIGTGLNGIVVIMHEPLPDPLLPAAVEALDDSLKPGLVGWREDRDDIELQAESNDATKGIRKLTCSTKNGVVVELGIIRQTVNSPVCNQGIRGGLGGPGGSHPTGAKSSMQTDPGHDVDVCAAPQTKVLDEVEAIHVRPHGSDAWQVPAFGRGRPTNSTPSIESAAPQEDSANGAKGGNLLESALLEGKLDRHGTELSQVTRIPKLLTNSEDQILNAPRRGDLLASSTAWPIEPDDALHTLIPGAVHPTLNRSQCHAKLLRYRTLRASPSNSPDDLLTTQLSPVF